MAAELVTLPDVSRRLGLTPATAGNYAARFPESFPAPVAKFGKAAVYWWPEVELWLTLAGKYLAPAVLNPTEET